MTTHQNYLEFAPPPTPGMLRGVILALLAHGLLVAMLTLGVQWKRDAPLVTAEAELWSAIPQEAAPPAAPPERPVPEPTPPPKPEPAPPEPKPPEPPPVVAPPAPPQPDPSITIARDKARVLKEKQLADKLAAEKLALEKLAKEKLEKAKAQKVKEANDAQAVRDRQAADKLAAEKLAADKKRAAANAKPQESAADAKRLADVRQQALKRMAALAGSGSDNSQGTAAQSGGPSAGYAGRIRARIKPNITFTETLSGNPLADVEVRTSPDGTIISRRIVKSSGIKSWDEAVLAAIDKTEVLPRDVDGRVPPVLIIGFKPRD